MASAPVGVTLANQGARDALAGGAEFEFMETEIDIKHEGMTLAYSVALKRSAKRPEPPEWSQENKHRPV